MRLRPPLWTIGALWTCLASGCWNSQDAGGHRERAARAPSFTDIARSAGLEHPSQGGSPEKLSILENIGSGAGFLDADRDGNLDAVVLSGGPGAGATHVPDVAVRFYRQSRPGTFREETDRWGLTFNGWGTGVAVGDVDNDGAPDLLITCYGQDRFFRNREGTRFEDATDSAGFLLADATTDFSTSAVFFDYNADGRLDLYVTRYVALDRERPPNGGHPCLTNDVPVACAPHFHPPLADRLYRNAGARFVDVTVEAGVGKSEGAYGLGVAAGDLDGDGRTDLYVANDTTANVLWRNVDGRRFTDDALFSGCALDDEGRGQAGMGVDLADLNQDGALDIIVTNYSQETNALYLNLGAGAFENGARRANLWQASYLRLGWGVKACDWNSDGKLDLAIANGHVYPRADEINPALSYAQPCLFLQADGHQFVDRADTLGEAASRARAHRALATGDFDNDGDVDILLSVMDSPPVLLANEQRGASWLSLRLQGTRSNRDAIGAKVWLTAGGQTQFREVTRGGSYLSAHDPRLLFGLGTIEHIDSVRVVWPSGTTESFEALTARKAYKIVEDTGRAVTVESNAG